MPVYIRSASQISAQQPFSDAWFDAPEYPDAERVRSVDPSFAQYISPIQSRRMGPLLKRVVVTARRTLADAGVAMPDAIITGTGLGCIDNTERFIYSIMENDEQLLQPTYFMQSTHNILSSAIAIELKCHGQNNTFVHRGVSFEQALLESCRQLEAGRIRTALTGGYDELTDDYYIFFRRIGLYDFRNEADSPKHRCFAAETAVSMLLATDPDERDVCRIDAADIVYTTDPDRVARAALRLLDTARCNPADVAVVAGLNTNPDNDAAYRTVLNRIAPAAPIVGYKHLFGQSFTSSAQGVYVAARCLERGTVPAHLRLDADTPIEGVKQLLCYNHYGNKSHSFILLSRC